MSSRRVRLDGDPPTERSKVMAFSTASLAGRPLWQRLLGLFLALYLVYEGYEWMFARVYVPVGSMLVLTARFGESPPPGQVLAKPGQKGIQEQVYGEGRYFFSPIWYKRELFTLDSLNMIIAPDEVGLVISKVGTELPPGEFLADEGQKGIWRRVLTPGRWRLNPYGYEVKRLPAVMIPPGFVGCVTSLSGKIAAPGALSQPGQRGIQQNVLQPGIYFNNPREFRIEPVNIGYRQLTVDNVSFPSADGFTITLDTTVVWGLDPQDVPDTIMNFGNVADVVNKVIDPQVMSISRIEGSKNRAQDFIEGEKREAFQNAFTNSLKKVTSEKNIETEIALVRDIAVPDTIRGPIQDTKIAVEVQLTKQEQIQTQQIYNELEQLKAEVDKGVKEVAAETDKMVAEAMAKGDAEMARIDATTQVKVAEIQRQAAELQAEKTRKLGKASADVEEMLQAARADRFTQNVQALGSPTAYANYLFATGLRSDLQVVLRYAGAGTFWTDLPSVLKTPQELAGMQILDEKTQAPKSNDGGRK
jgi:regulator of protease activity HflC (stomatin/prohibitin superfamily)